jgi:hypothetical protein
MISDNPKASGAAARRNDAALAVWLMNGDARTVRQVRIDEQFRARSAAGKR